MADYPKKGQFDDRRGKPGKSLSEQSLVFGEVVQLPGGVPTDRQFTKIYKPGEAADQGPPMGMPPFA